LKLVPTTLEDDVAISVLCIVKDEADGDAARASLTAAGYSAQDIVVGSVEAAGSVAAAISAVARSAVATGAAKILVLEGQHQIPAKFAETVSHVALGANDGAIAVSHAVERVPANGLVVPRDHALVAYNTCTAFVVDSRLISYFATAANPVRPNDGLWMQIPRACRFMGLRFIVVANGAIGEISQVAPPPPPPSAVDEFKKRPAETTTTQAPQTTTSAAPTSPSSEAAGE